MSRFLKFAAACFAGALVLAPVSSAADLGALTGRTAPAESDEPGMTPCTSYFVRIKTGDVRDANSDGLPFVEIHGTELATTGQIFLLDRGMQRPAGAVSNGTCEKDGVTFASVNDGKDKGKPARPFERNQTDGFWIWAADVGKPTAVTIGVSAANVAFSAKWFVDTVYVEKADCTGRSGLCIRHNFDEGGDDEMEPNSVEWNAAPPWLGVYYDWVDIDKPQRITLVKEDNTAPLNVSIQTAGQYYSGTDADITIKLTGTTQGGQPFNWAGPINALIDGHPFESGKLDKFKIYGLPALARINSVSVKSKMNNGLSPDWELVHIDLQSPTLCGKIAPSDDPPPPCERGQPERYWFVGWLDDQHPIATANASSMDLATSDKIAQMKTVADQEQFLRTTAGYCERDPGPCGANWREGINKLLADIGAAPLDFTAPVDQPQASVEPEPTAKPAPAAEPPQAGGGGMSEEDRCRGMVDGRVAYDREGHTAWNAGNIELLCRGATSAEARIACFEAGIEAHGDWGRAIADCQQSDNASPARAEPSASEPEAEPVAGPEPSASEPIAEPEPTGGTCDAALEDQCRALLQDQVPWTNRDADNPANRHWNPENLDALCACTTDAPGTVQCFQNELASNGNSWSAAIDTCKAP